MQSASRVGALLVLATGLAFGAYQFIGKPMLAPKADSYFAEFPDAAGIPLGTRVLMAGVQIGTVEEIELLSTFKGAKLTLRINSPHRIPKGSRAVISTSFTGLGDNPVTILPPSTATSLMTPGDTISGAKVGALDGMVPGANDLLKELTATLKATRTIIEDKKMIGHIDDLLVSTNKSMQQFGQLAEKAGGMTGEMQKTLVANQSNITLAMKNLAGTMVNVNQTTAEVAKLLKEGKFQKESLGLVASLNSTVQESQKLIKDMDKLIGDPKFQDSIKGTMSNVADMTKSGTKIASDTAKMTENGITISQNVADLTKKANELADSTKELLEKLKRTLDKSPFGGGGGGAKNPLNSFQANMDLIRETKDRRFRTDLDLRLPYDDGFLSFGLFDAFEGNKLNAQVGRFFGPGKDLRFGVYASKPGVGLDYTLRPGLSLRGDLFDLNRPRLDLRAKFDFKEGIYGWFGYQRLGSRGGTPILGVGIRK